MEIEGIIIEVLPERSGTSERTGKAWRVAEYVIETLERYPKKMLFSVTDGENGRIARLNIQKDKRMKVWFDVDAQTFDGKWYNRIQAYDAREVK